MMLFRWLKNDIDWLPKLVNVGAIAVGLILLFMGFLQPWMAVPTVNDGVNSTVDSEYSSYFKCILAIVYLAVLMVLAVRREKNMLFFLVMGMVAFSICLYYPALVGQRDADIMGDAAWVQQQHDNMSWLGGDVFRAHSERMINHGQGVNAQDPPSRLAIYKPPVGKLGINRLNDWIWWLGYGPSFAQFVGKGWFMSTAGAGVLLLCSIGYSWRRSIQETRLLLRKKIAVFVTLIFAVVSIGVVPILLANSHLNKAKAFLSEGDYRNSYMQLNKAAMALPTLKCDSGMLRQLGYLELRLGIQETGCSQLYMIHEYEANGYFRRAREIISRMTAQYHDYPRFIQRELMRHHLRVAINEVNSNRATSAMNRLEQILEKYPTTIQAILHIQLIALKQGNVEKVRLMHEKLFTLYKTIKSRNKRGVIAVSYLMLSQAEMEAGNPEASAEARRMSKGL